MKMIQFSPTSLLNKLNLLTANSNRRTWTKPGFFLSLASLCLLLMLSACEQKEDLELKPTVSEENTQSLAGACTDQLTANLLEAARKEGVDIDENAIAVGVSPVGTIVHAAVKGLSGVDMIDYENGVAASFIYIDSPESALRKGHYLVNSIADKVELGRISLKAQYIQDGKVIETSTGVAQITSLTVPPEVEPLVVTGLSILPLPDEDSDRVPVFTYYVKCTNGGYTCHHIPCPGGC